MEIPIGQTRPRGQPKKTTTALMKQNYYKLSSDNTESELTPKKKRSQKVKSKKKKQKRGRKPKNIK